MAKQERVMLHPTKTVHHINGLEIKTIYCGWSDADYKTTLYWRLNGKGVARICDCVGFYYKSKCYHLAALEEWARKSKEQSNEQE